MYATVCIAGKFTHWDIGDIHSDTYIYMYTFMYMRTYAYCVTHKLLRILCYIMSINTCTRILKIIIFVSCIPNCVCIYAHIYIHFDILLNLTLVKSKIYEINLLIDVINNILKFAGFVKFCFFCWSFSCISLSFISVIHIHWIFIRYFEGATTFPNESYATYERQICFHLV